MTEAAITVLRGNPTDEELAVLVGVLAAAPQPVGTEAPARSAWWSSGLPGRARPGRDAWRRSAQPRP